MMKSITLFLVLLGYCAADAVSSNSNGIQLSKESAIYFDRSLQNILVKQQLALSNTGKDRERLLKCVAFDLASYVSQLSLELKVDIAILMTQMGLSQSVQDTVTTILRGGIISADFGPGGVEGLVSKLLPSVTKIVGSLLSTVTNLVGNAVSTVNGLVSGVLGTGGGAGSVVGGLVDLGGFTNLLNGLLGAVPSKV